MSRSKAVPATLAALILLAVVACILAVGAIPPDAKIGMWVRFTMFHGASTWVNIASFTLAGIFGGAFLAGASGLRAWDEAFRWLALPHWAINSVLGVISMKVLWGDVGLEEPKLAMTVVVLGASALILAVQFITDHPKLVAGLDALLAAGLWTAVLLVPNVTHPDSPVFNSPDPVYRYAFFGMVGSILVIVVALAVLAGARKRRLAFGDAE